MESSHRCRAAKVVVGGLPGTVTSAAGRRRDDAGNLTETAPIGGRAAERRPQPSRRSGKTVIGPQTVRSDPLRTVPVRREGVPPFRTMG